MKDKVIREVTVRESNIWEDGVVTKGLFCTLSCQNTQEWLLPLASTSHCVNKENVLSYTVYLTYQREKSEAVQLHVRENTAQHD